METGFSELILITIATTTINLVLGGNGEPGSGTLWSTHGLAILPGIVTVTVTVTVVVVVVVVIPNTVTLWNVIGLATLFYEKVLRLLLFDDGAHLHCHLHRFHHRRAADGRAWDG